MLPPHCRRLLHPPQGERAKNERVRNWLKAMCFDEPDWIPCSIGLVAATWLKYGQALDELVLRHPRLFPGHRPGGHERVHLGPRYRRGIFTDAWGTVWKNIADGMDAIPVEEKAPLKEWSAMAEYQPPPPDVNDWGDRIDWEGMPNRFERTKEGGGLAIGGLDHGFMYMRLYYLRGFTNLMMDIASGEPRLEALIEMVAGRNRTLVERYVEAGVEMVWAGDDLGMQTALPVSPDHWRRYVKPAYMHIFQPCRDNHIPVYLHSDGHIVEIIPDLVECGITVINPQIRANGLEEIARVAKGRVAVNLDLDRQLFPFATPGQIHEHVRQAVEVLGSSEGGLMLHAECEPDVPLENIEAILQALEEVGGGPWL